MKIAWLNQNANATFFEMKFINVNDFVRVPWSEYMPTKLIKHNNEGWRCRERTLLSVKSLERLEHEYDASNSFWLMIDGAALIFLYSAIWALATGAINPLVGVYGVAAGTFFFIACEFYRRWALERIGDEIDRKVKESMKQL
ncbi:MAG: hypothetical protein AOA65_0752 [Candidatus Bathyarchaeota archaeon BA1]|nr:MAG: hypothetical protein AOA65_0752 [Candidatus Bathyarchaeota archaeon BA1]